MQLIKVLLDGNVLAITNSANSKFALQTLKAIYAEKEIDLWQRHHDMNIYQK